MTMSRNESLIRALEEVCDILSSMKDKPSIICGDEAATREEADLIVQTSGLCSEQAIKSVEQDLVKHARLILKHRKMRRGHLPEQIFGEPGWEMLLDLFIHMNLGKAVNISSMCLATNAPKTTALRYIELLAEMGLIQKVASPHDGRITYVKLTPKAYVSLGTYLLEVSRATPELNIAHAEIVRSKI